MARRVTALLAALLMANAALASTGWECRATLGESATSSGDRAQVHNAPGTTGHDDCDNCDDCCCGAFAPCALSLGIAGVAVTIGMPLERNAGVTIPGLVAPEVLVTSPDPPPPKA